VFFGDRGGNFYALDAANGQKLWSRQLGGAIGGALRANDRQRQESHIGFRSVVRT
jgi:outer membrane protein assembly factor BamB